MPNYVLPVKHDETLHFLLKPKSLLHTRVRSGEIFVAVVFLPGIELILFIAAYMVLCFRFVLHQTVLIAQECFSYC